MAQQKAWYRKHRPKTFEGYSGDFADSAVKRFADPLKRPQVTLLYGHYGCGKTTAARLLTGFYMCESLTAEGMPCCKCAGCRQLEDLIATGEDDAASESVQEINGSAVNGVADIKRIMNESMMTLPSFSKYKVFIIDECHRITPEAQNALLKILEDIPEHLVIIFATTEKDKILPTVLSRCQVVIEVRKQTLKNMADMLQNISVKEGLTVERKALELIAKKGNRVPRDCINMLEDIASSYNNTVTTKNVLTYTGDTDEAVYLKFITAAHKGLPEILAFISDFSQNDMDYHKFLSGLSRYVLDAVYVRMALLTDEHDKTYVTNLRKLFAQYKVDEFQVLLKLVDNAARRASSTIGSSDLVLSVLALNIGDITKVQRAVSADSVKVLADRETSEGAKKFVERDTEVRFEEKGNKSSLATNLDDFMASLGAVDYEQKD